MSESMLHRILVVDDDPDVRDTLDLVLSNTPLDVKTARGVEEACAVLEEESFDAVLTDLRMGNNRDAGMEVLSWLKEKSPGTPAIMMTAHGSVESAIKAMNSGATDYIQKPFKNEEIRIRIKRAIKARDQQRENEALRKEQARRGDIDNMIGKSPAFQEVLEMVRRVAALPSTVAIHGESGVGKELVAQALHTLSNRSKKPFVAINCGGIPENLLESELFGHKKGAFTGAIEDKEGLFVVANGGTIFLDEVGEMPLMLQVKLLRVLDNSLVAPVGGTSSVKVDVRLISATNRDLEKMSEEGTFRSDLYYRLNVIPLTVPPLRERVDDIPLLARYYLGRHAEKMGLDKLDMSGEAEAAIRNYAWPGNVRELGNVMERALALCNGKEIDLKDLPTNFQQFVPEGLPVFSALPAGGINLEELIEQLEISLIEQALEKSKFSQKKAAQLLGLSARSLRYRLQKYELEGQ